MGGWGERETGAPRSLPRRIAAFEHMNGIHQIHVSLKGKTCCFASDGAKIAIGKEYGENRTDTGIFAMQMRLANPSTETVPPVIPVTGAGPTAVFAAPSRGIRCLTDSSAARGSPHGATPYP